MIERMVCRANDVLLFAFVALLIVLPEAYWFVALLSLVVFAVGFAIRRGVTPWRLDRDDAWLCLALVFYGGIWLLDVWRSGYWPRVDGAGYQLLPIWPLVAALILVGMRCYPPNPRMLWWGACCGALGAGTIALYERVVLGVERASNGMNAIPFGNLSLLLGSLSLLTVLWCLRRQRPRHVGLLILAMLAALLGLLGSLLSGTRGGWVALPFVLLIVYRAARDLLPLRHLRLGAGGLVLLMLVPILLPQSGVSERVGQVADDAQRYWQRGDAGSSLGMRLELWRAGVMLISEKPLLGFGEHRMEKALGDLAEEGRVYDRVVIHMQLHNEVIDTAARRGLLGATSLLLLYGIPLWIFWKKLRRAGHEPGLQVLAAAGMMVPVAFFDFGLTQSMLRDLRGLSGYLGLCVLCWVALRAYEETLRALPISSPPLHRTPYIADDKGELIVQRSRSRS
ncbi:O-antigen ligase family protein [Halomonas sp. ANAO-440]|uniref:O-antigen ligase family protein n=1 Tax=Halomonas sp. ANAO-440 TaxID=2861360 RepID=UPI001CAA5E84|nr:O-antigen ligase family protein [Halomonas sp. ANAO-440]MBZ0329218.1 O-antigen ligase family protein [Halomonas sp. ANAO-440]